MKLERKQTLRTSRHKSSEFNTLRVIFLPLGGIGPPLLISLFLYPHESQVLLITTTSLKNGTSNRSQRTMDKRRREKRERKSILVEEGYSLEAFSLQQVDCTSNSEKETSSRLRFLKLSSLCSIFLQLLKD